MIKPINPVARAVALNRRRSQVVPPKKGKGSYNRNKEKSNARKSQHGKDASEEAT